LIAIVASVPCIDGVPPGVNPDGAALKLTLVGADRSYEFNINLN